MRTVFIWYLVNIIPDSLVITDPNKSLFNYCNVILQIIFTGLHILTDFIGSHGNCCLANIKLKDNIHKQECLWVNLKIVSCGENFRKITCTVDILNGHMECMSTGLILDMGMWRQRKMHDELHNLMITIMLGKLHGWWTSVMVACLDGYISMTE